MSDTENVNRWVRDINPYGPRYYFLHRENILRQLAELQKTRGVINPGHLNRVRLLAVRVEGRGGEMENQLHVFKGRSADDATP